MCVQIWETGFDQSFQLVELQVKMLEMFSKKRDSSIGSCILNETIKMFTNRH
jgi:hypothetical protein